MFQRHSQLLGDCLKRLFSAKVLVAGVGGLGCTVSSLLVRLGVGHVYLLDSGVVDEPDLNRQILYDRSDLGQRKVEVAQKKLCQINPHCEIVPMHMRIDPDFCLPSVDVVIDCLDNFESKFTLDILCEKKQIPLVHAGVEGFSGQLMNVLPGSVRLRQIFSAAPKEGAIRQVYPPLVTLIASLQVNEAVKLICGDVTGLVNELMLIDLASMRFERIKIRGGAN
ncbi:MAG: UBA/THIF-type NAD/FAD binding protein [Thermotoga sp. 50_1627]|uniref:HesA/MoeB/ThiF family protein n=1 Tax=Pseudothermotoga sp. TaxID=2033661 RepID=UPI00076C03C8|nr:MAG: UBA/THIF-type NAD/FAD binding protein [Thermotoga sp. 50_64]KUK24959.1 MAG: UBA/THIF-type NAD/FAD binding protein [Thermotoga sp. 50_1627]MBC7116651.1 HesA/MoeB/ThiF family protein [Pseudothermotoga sp.]MDK2922766.1 molybdopterin-synthase adenylyltransferase [Pseudothermotoga sp.]HBT39312.1 thiamine biosynthesis protein ThiF [Pseudothermotoga sp.]